jgi:hypothetical protein
VFIDLLFKNMFCLIISVLFSLFLFAEGITCTSNQYTCQSWPGIYVTSEKDTCITTAFVCDGRIDCPLGDDEWNCPTCNATTGFYCNQTSPAICINGAFKCDGVWDCPHQEDEISSLCGACNFTVQWQCPSTGRCIQKTQLCDGRVDCLDEEDEIFSNCYNVSFYDSNNAMNAKYISLADSNSYSSNNNNSTAVNTITIIFIILVSVLILLLLCFMYLFLRYYVQSKYLENQIQTSQNKIEYLNNEEILITQAQPQTPLLEQDIVTNFIISPRSTKTGIISPRLNKLVSPRHHINNIKTNMTPRARSNQPTPKSTGRRTPISLPPIITHMITGNTPRHDGYQKVLRQESQLSEINDEDNGQDSNHMIDQDDIKHDDHGNEVNYEHVSVDKLKQHEHNHHNHNHNHNNHNYNNPQNDNDEDEDEEDNEQQGLNKNHDNMSPSAETPL